MFKKASGFYIQLHIYDLSAPKTIFSVSLITIRFKFVHMDSHTAGKRKKKKRSPEVSPRLRFIQRYKFVPALKM